jgi:hypothetical protein
LKEFNLVFGDLKPANIIFYRYLDRKNCEKSIYLPCYKIKIIDLGGIVFLENSE